MKLLLPISYLPGTAYLRSWKSAEEVLLETQEHFPKQTLRNRCTILSANGPLHLIIPVQKAGTHKKKTAEVRISYAEKWNRTHWRSIVSAYKKAPYFEDYEFRYAPLFEREFDLLIDFTNQLNQQLFKDLQLPYHPKCSTEFETLPIGKMDLRSDEKILSYSNAPFISYTQVFADRFPFMPNLSGLDLLFNCGPSSPLYF